MTRRMILIRLRGLRRWLLCWRSVVGFLFSLSPVFFHFLAFLLFRHWRSVWEKTVARASHSPELWCWHRQRERGQHLTEMMTRSCCLMSI
jgi:hypothetical protein